jgi:hypothetical protein
LEPDRRSHEFLNLCSGMLAPCHLQQVQPKH